MSNRILVLLVLLAATVGSHALADDSPNGMDFARLAALRSVRSAEISPDGQWVAYTLSVPRRPGQDKDGSAWSELHLVPFDGGPCRAYVHGDVSVSSVRFMPDSSEVTYLAKRGDDEKAALWSIPVGGGESRKLASHEGGVGDYRISPDGKRVAFLATEPEDKERKELREKGYKQEVFEEEWRPRKVWIAEIPEPAPASTDPSAPPAEDDDADDEPRALEIDGSAFELEWSPDGTQLAVTLAPTPLIDDRYMARRIHMVKAEDGAIVSKIENPGKLGAFEVSPDGAHVAMVTADDPNDPMEGRLKVASTAGGPLRDLIPDFEGHVSRIAWKDSKTVAFIANVGVESVLGEVDLETREQKIDAKSGNGAPHLGSLSLSSLGRAAFTGQSPQHPMEVFVATADGAPRRLTDSNPWLGDVALAKQEVITWEARDGLELEGLLIHPLESTGKPAPLLLMVHGGPESHDKNGWVTAYSRPGQLAAAAGYAVLYPNYRGSTGRGVAFSKLGQGDAAGKEFDDLVDAVDHLVEVGVADRDRVGITGGSYGGYATAWSSTRHTEHFRAGVMFVGISNKVSKGLTTPGPSGSSAWSGARSTTRRSHARRC
jgi:dipeptidyl aminopeptidase/acylaminoacyl peptidase